MPEASQTRAAIALLLLFAPSLPGCGGEPEAVVPANRPPMSKEEIEKGPPGPANAAPPVQLK